MAALGVVCVIVNWFDGPAMVALPDVTTPPVGCAMATDPQASMTSKDTALMRKAAPPGLPAEAALPELRACSETATKVPVERFQMERWMWFMLYLL
ncbi:hypothetical protein Y695_04237 [Hydrogenophaga sp. T4]|nr:hypothetical protein Y695_04237 [Hydrogenophaga sp. T4]